MIHDHAKVFEVALMCELLEVSRQGYYDWIGRPASPLSIRRDRVIAAIRQSHVESHCRYGSPNIHRDLLENGMKCCVNTVAKHMKENCIASCVHKKFRVTTTDSSHPHPVFENRLDRDFTAAGMNRKWAADITYIHTHEGFLYLAGIVDLFSRRIIGWAMKDTLHADLCVEALEMALVNRRPKHPVLHHSDRGCQYAGKQYQDKRIEFSLECSMSGVGNCWDNAVVESLWASLKNELVFQRTFATKQEAMDAIFEWIVVGYNRKRRHSSLGYVSPEAFEAKQN